MPPAGSQARPRPGLIHFSFSADKPGLTPGGTTPPLPEVISGFPASLDALDTGLRGSLYVEKRVVVVAAAELIRSTGIFSSSCNRLPIRDPAGFNDQIAFIQDETQVFEKHRK